MLGGAIELPTMPADLSTMRSQFFDKTGYSSRDLLSFNALTRQFYTRNGGLYFLSVSGEVEHLKGPSPDPEDRL